MNLRKYAQGKPCMIGSIYCTCNPEETVLAHWRDSTTGMGKKECDLLGAWACSKCHDLVDGRLYDPNISHNERMELHIEGMIRTQQQLVRDGIIKW